MDKRQGSGRTHVAEASRVETALGKERESDEGVALFMEGGRRDQRVEGGEN